jgi:hypothetical protein
MTQAMALKTSLVKTLAQLFPPNRPMGQSMGMGV